MKQSKGGDHSTAHRAAKPPKGNSIGRVSQEFQPPKVRPSPAFFSAPVQKGTSAEELALGLATLMMFIK